MEKEYIKAIKDVLYKKGYSENEIYDILEMFYCEVGKQTINDKKQGKEKVDK